MMKDFICEQIENESEGSGVYVLYGDEIIAEVHPQEPPHPLRIHTKNSQIHSVSGKEFPRYVSLDFLGN